MASQPPVLNHRGKKWGNNFFDVIYPLIGLIVILVNNWGKSNRHSLQTNGLKDIDDVMNVGGWILRTGKHILIFLVVWFLVSWLFDSAHNMLFGKKAKPNLIWKAFAYTCFLAVVYFFTK